MPAGSGDQWPHEYERGRPGWPREVIEVQGLPLSATVLDLGAGTGKLTRLLASRFDEVVAVEPADAMRRVLATLCPQAHARQGHARDIPLPDAEVGLADIETRQLDLDPLMVLVIGTRTG